MAPSENEQAFDLMVLAYGPTHIAPDRDDFGHIDIPGYKVAGYGAFLRDHSDIVARYDQVALIDDDIEADYRALGQTFELGRDHDLKLWQPSLTWESYFSYAALLKQPVNSRPRYINYIEMMCPFFKTSTLLDLSNLFQLGAETGIDILWSCVVGEDPWGLAVLDAVSVTHTRPVGLLKAMNGFQETSYDDHIYSLLSDFGVALFPGAIPRGYPPSANPSAAMRLRLAYAALTIAGVVYETRMSKLQVLHAWLAGLRQILIRGTRIDGDPAVILKRAAQYAAAYSQTQT
jgi:hypothetical protein